jgi:hypothetical protein
MLGIYLLKDAYEATEKTRAFPAMSHVGQWVSKKVYGIAVVEV